MIKFPLASSMVDLTVFNARYSCIPPLYFVFFTIEFILLNLSSFSKKIPSDSSNIATFFPVRPILSSNPPSYIPPRNAFFDSFTRFVILSLSSSFFQLSSNVQSPSPLLVTLRVFLPSSLLQTYNSAISSKSVFRTCVNNSSTHRDL